MVDNKIVTQALETVQHLSALNEAQGRELSRRLESEKRARDLAPALVELLVKHYPSLNQPHLRKSAAEKLADHASALDLLQNVLTYRFDPTQGQEVETLGQPHGRAKQAGADAGQERFHVPGAPGGPQRESDLLLERFVFGGRR